MLVGVVVVVGAWSAVSVAPRCQSSFWLGVTGKSLRGRKSSAGRLESWGNFFYLGKVHNSNSWLSLKTAPEKKLKIVRKCFPVPLLPLLLKSGFSFSSHEVFLNSTTGSVSGVVGKKKYMASYLYWNFKIVFSMGTFFTPRCQWHRGVKNSIFYTKYLGEIDSIFEQF